MSNFSSSETSNNYDEYPQVAQEDLERAKFRIGLKPRRLLQNIHALIRYGERSGYVAECTEIAVVTQGQTLDQVVSNLQEAVFLHLDGEDLADFGLVPQPTILISLELQLEYA